MRTFILNIQELDFHVDQKKLLDMEWMFA